MTPVLYILMRTDLASLNPGKAMAQGAHAATAFERKIAQMSNDGALKPETREAYRVWSESTSQGFGTKIVLDAGTEDGINEILFSANFNGKFDTIGDIINDPTYPIRDGNVTHYIPLNTCGYIFTDTDKWRPHRDYSLHK